MDGLYKEWEWEGGGALKKNQYTQITNEDI